VNESHLVGIGPDPTIGRHVRRSPAQGLVEKHLDVEAVGGMHIREKEGSMNGEVLSRHTQHLLGVVRALSD
jgi:hypothetical protein